MNHIQTIVLSSLVAFILASGVVRADEDRAAFDWIDAASFVEGRGFADAEIYGRLPKRAWERQGLDKVLGAGNHATGLCLRFTTDSQELRFRYTLKSSSKDDAWCGWAGLYGIDVYSRGTGNMERGWRFERVGYDKKRANNQEWKLRRKLTPNETCLVYLPFRGEVEKFEIGIEKGKCITRIAPPKKRIVHYGTSLVHGGCVTRAGMLFTSIYGRLADVEVVNLGFSGAAHMQLDMAEFQAEVPADLYIVDPALNNDAKGIREKLGPYVKYIREKRPDTPILICEPASTFEKVTDRSIAVREVYDALVKEGMQHLYIIATAELMLDDSEGTVDGIHPNEYGAMQMGRAFAKKIEEILAAESPAVQMLKSEMKRMPVPCDIDKRKRPKWEYTDGLELQGALAVGEAYPAVRAEARAWARDYIDRMVTPDGEILGYRMEDCKLDNINTGKFAFDMYELAVREGNEAEAARLKKALDSQFAQFAIQPRTSEGGFWHKTVYPHQMWLDGLYMGAPFYARYAAKFLDGKERDKAFADVLKQFELVMSHTYDAETGLYRHGWDEAKEQIWADKATGQSRHAWGRALGWFAAAMAETLEYIPEDVKGRDVLVRRFQSFARSLEAWQDKSGAWWQVADQPGREGNYLEATATSLIGYALMKGYNRGWLDGSARDTARRALNALQRDFLRHDVDGTVSLTRCCAVAGLSANRDGSFEYYLREPIRDNDAKGTGSYMLLCLENEELRMKNEECLPRIETLQAEIDAVAANGGGRVVVPTGQWLTGAIHLKSNVELHLEEGATLVFTENLSDYLPAVRTSWEGVECMGYSPLVYAYGCTNVAVTGKGTLKALVEDHWRAWGLNRKKNPAHDEANRKLKADWAYGDKPVEERNFWQLPESLHRPGFVQFNRCKDVRLEGVKIRESPFWTIHLLCCDGVVVRDVDSFATCKNSDGIDIESSRNVLVENCIFEQGDDAVVIKAGLNHEGRRRAMPSEDIVIRNCVINEGHSMLSIGSELSGGIRNVLMEDCRAESDIDKVFFIKTNPERGGFVENVTMRRIKAKGVRYQLVSAITDYFWKDGMTTPDGILRATPVNNIVLEDIEADSASETYSFRGYPTEPIRNLTLNNVRAGEVKKPSSAVYVEGLKGNAVQEQSNQ